MRTENERLEFYTGVEELINDTRMGRHHVVILGAGASRQAFPTGDGNGNKLPLMCDLVEITGLDSELSKHGIDYEGKNFETIYSDLAQDSGYKELINVVQTRIWKYFSNLVLPPYPTLYDHLVLSLRDKDLIATFNWDPLLYYACWRNHEKTPLPHIAYLHDNVAVGYCVKDKTCGYIKSKCIKCGRNYTPSRLLYPIKKNYSQEASIKLEWDTLRQTLGSAYMLTIFGYSAPQSDIEAIRLMKDAWLANTTGDINQVEIIDTKHEDELIENWRGFTPYHHYNITKDFYSSSIGLFPRRTCEAEWRYSMPKEPVFYPHNPIPKSLGFEELWQWYTPLIDVENKKAQS